MSLLDKGRYKTFVGTLHCALENGADLYVNERQKIRQYRARSAEERMPNLFFFLLRGGGGRGGGGVRKIAPRYSSVCNVLRQWSISLIPTYKVYRLYNNCI